MKFEINGRTFVENNPMGGYGTLNVTPHHVVLMGECGNCGARREIDRDKIGRHHAHAWLTDIAKCLRCDSCGKKEGKLMTGYYVTEDAQR